jgi:hypothetical protein
VGGADCPQLQSDPAAVPRVSSSVTSTRGNEDRPRSGAAKAWGRPWAHWVGLAGFGQCAWSARLGRCAALGLHQAGVAALATMGDLRILGLREPPQAPVRVSTLQWPPLAKM